MLPRVSSFSLKYPFCLNYVQSVKLFTMCLVFALVCHIPTTSSRRIRDNKNSQHGSIHAKHSSFTRSSHICPTNILTFYFHLTHQNSRTTHKHHTHTHTRREETRRNIYPPELDNRSAQLLLLLFLLFLWWCVVFQMTSGLTFTPGSPTGPPAPPAPAFLEMRRRARTLCTYALISFWILMGLISPVRL